MTDLFIELFPIVTDGLPSITAYAIQFADPEAAQHSGKLAYRLARTFPGRWVWAQGYLLTDAPVSPVQMDITMDILRNQFPDLYGTLQSVEEDPRAAISPALLADFVARSMIRDTEDELRAALAKLTISIKNAVIEREPVTQTWVAGGEAALSISIRSHLRYIHSLSQVIAEQGREVIGLRVMDNTAPSMTGLITDITGTLAQHRDRLMSLTKRPVMQNLLKSAPDDEPVVSVESGEYHYDYASSALHILVRQESNELQRFGIVPQQAHQGMRLRPDMRAGLVRTVSDVLKQKGIIGNAYNTRTHPHLFAAVDFMPNLVYGERRVLPYRAESVGFDFTKGGLYRRHPRFENAPVRIAVINTMDDIIEDFVEAMRRQMERTFGLKIEMIKERKVRVMSAGNLKSAVRVVEKENANIVLAFLKEEVEEDANYAALKSMTLGKGIASHAIYESTLNNPAAMPLVIMGVLAKCGNIPFALAEPLEYADYVVGLGLVCEKLKHGDRVTALSRIYRSDGVFVRYVMDSLDLEKDEPVPFVLMQTLFPNDVFENQRVIVHHDGAMAAETLRLLTRWQTVIGAHFTPVEILRQHVPRLYGLAQKVSQPPWGSMFRLSDSEAFIVSSAPPPDSTAQPLHVRVREGALAIEQAVYSVLAWTLLHYGMANTPRLPVTIQHAEDIAVWLAKGMLPAAKEGDVPFWL